MKLGMVFEGGANRTVFSCGVMDKFLEENIMPDYYIGVSAGMAYGLSYLSGQKGRNLELMEKYMADKRYMGMRHLLNRKEHAYYNTKFVFEEVPNELLPLDYDALARFPGEIEAAVTNIHTGKAEYMEVPRGKEMKDLLIATCSLPILFQPVKIGRHYYLDGGLADSVPYEHAMEMGCEKLVVVLRGDGVKLFTILVGGLVHHRAGALGRKGVGCLFFRLAFCRGGLRLVTLCIGRDDQQRGAQGRQQGVPVRVEPAGVIVGMGVKIHGVSP